MNYYTYAYLREDGTPYYIGKGKGDRVYNKRKGQIRPPKDKSRIIFLKQNVTEEEAFNHEIYMISVFGRKDLGNGILHNRTDGGDGASGAIRSEETRRKLSEFNKGKNNPNYGKSKILDEKTKHKISNSLKGHIPWNKGKKIKPHSEETKRKISESLKGKEKIKGKKWWYNPSTGKTKMSQNSPGNEWVLGRIGNT